MGTLGCQAWTAWHCRAPCPRRRRLLRSEGGWQQEETRHYCSQPVPRFLGDRDFAGNPGQRCLKDVNYFFLHFSNFFLSSANVPANWKCQRFSLTFSAPVLKSNHEQEALTSRWEPAESLITFSPPTAQLLGSSLRSAAEEWAERQSCTIRDLHKFGWPG